MSEARHITPGPWVAAHVDSQKLPIFPDAKCPKPIRIGSSVGAVADVFYEPDDVAEATMRANAEVWGGAPTGAASRTTAGLCPGAGEK